MFTFKFNKAIQATAYLLRRETSREMNYMRLLKILYIADRESIRLTGWPITGARTAAMNKGPVLSEIFDLIKGCNLHYDQWAKYIQRNEYQIRLIDEPGLSALSRFDVETLERIAEEHRSHDEWDMVEFTHTFPEWKKNYDENCLMTWIPTKDIFEAVGRTINHELEQEIKEDRIFNRLFGN